MNLFENILNGYKTSYLGSGQLGSDVYDSLNKQKIPKNTTLNSQDIEFINQAISKGATKEKAFDLVTEFKYNQEQKQNIYKGNSSIDNPFMNVLGGAISEIPKVAGETASFLQKASQYMPTNLLGTAIEAGFSDKTYGQIREEQKAKSGKLATAGQAGKEFVQKYGAYNPESTGAKVGETVTDIGASLVGPNKVGTITKLGKLAIPTKIAMEGGLAGAKYDVATKGEITPESVGIGALANVGVAGSLKGLGKVYEGVTKRLPAGITLGGLINPGKLDVVKKSLQVDEGVATPEDVGKWILDRVKPGNKQEIAEQLIQHAEKTKGAVDEALGSIPTYFQNPTAKKALLQIRNELEGKVGMEGKIAQIDELLAKPEYTLSELNAVKRELDDMYNMYTKTGDPTAGLKAKGLRNVRADLRKFIEDEAEIYGVNIRKLNNETATARGLAEGILRKDSADGVRELLTAFAPSGAGAVISGVGSYKSGNDVLTALRDAVIGGVATKFATSTAVRTRIASALNRLAPKDLTALENYIRSGGKDEIGKKVAEKVIKEGRALPARTITKPSDFAKTPEKSIITPQTQERAIIQESKKGLSPNIKRPNGNTNNISSSSSNLPVRPKKVQKPSPQVKPVEKTVKAKQSNAISDKMASYKEIISNKTLPEETRVFAMRDMYELMIKEGKSRGLDITNTKEQLKKVNGVIKEKYIDSRKLGNLMKNTEKEIQKAKETIEYLKNKSQQKTVKPKNLTEGKESATMGDMETKKLIEEARKAKDFASFFMKKLGSKEVNKKNLLKLGISSEQIERNTFSNGISLEDIFYELKSGKLSSYPIK